MVTTLQRKLGRELWRLRGQMLSIALVVSTGVMAVITMRGSYNSLVDAQARYYRQTRFASVWSSLKRAPETVRGAIEQIPGVTAVETRVTFTATLNLPGLDAPGIGRFVSVPINSRPLLNDVVIVRGRYLAPDDQDAVLLSEKFATARKLAPGDSVRAVINGRLRALHVVGIALSPEHAYAVPPGSLYPDDLRYGVLWMARDALGPAYDMKGAFNDVALAINRDADTLAVMAQLNTILEPYGGLGAYARKNQPSHQVMQGELDGNRAMSTAIPAVFLGVAAFLLNLVLGRLIATQRTEIAVLKAFGYTNNAIGWHYLQFALAAVAAGVVLGVGLGVWAGQKYMALYGAYFGFPELNYELSAQLVAISTALSVLGAVGGAWSAVRHAITLPPAEAMRAEPPARFEPGWLERLGFIRGLSPAVRMIVRNVGRRPARTFVASLGVAFSVAILVIGLFMFDGVDFMMALQFRVVQREDLSVMFVEPLAATVKYAFAALPGVQRVEVFQTVPVRLRAGHRMREVALQSVASDARMRRIVAANGREFPLPSDGVVLDKLLADRLHVQRGDTLQVELLTGNRTTAPLLVSGIVEEFLGVSAYIAEGVLQRLVGGVPLASGVYLRVAADQRSALNTRLKALPIVASVASPASMLAAFQSQLANSLYIGVGFLLVFAGVIAVGVIYNGARVALSERARELASLRVMGFRRSEVTMLLLGEQAGITLVAIPLGWVLGYAVSFAVSAGLRTDLYRIPLIISARTYLIAAAITIFAAAASALLVRRRIHNLNLIAVLKTRE